MQRPAGLSSMLLAIGLLACAGPIPPQARDHPEPQPLHCGGPGVGTIELTYLGVGGVLIRYDDEAILTAPFYSHPNLARVLSLPVKPNTNRIDTYLLEKDQIEDVQGILVGHSHYDHAMDLPYIVTQYIDGNPPVYGSRTLKHLMTEAGSSLSVEEMNAKAGTWRRAGDWIPVIPGRLRIMALHSQHAPHVPGLTLAAGPLGAPRSRPPLFAKEWKEGQTFAYLIDFLDASGAPAFRIHYQDAASPPPWGFPPPVVLDERRVDVAIVCAGGFGLVPDYPQGVVRDLEPRHAVVGHWEDFFRSPGKKARVVRGGTDLDEFLVRLESALPGDSPPGKQNWTLPNPHAVIRFSVCP